MLRELAVKPQERFLLQPKEFWAYVRTVSQGTGYTVRGTGQIRIPTVEELRGVLEQLELRDDQLLAGTDLTPLGALLMDYFEHRARVLNDEVVGLLMDAPEAAAEFERMKVALSPTCPLPMNKQTAEKKAHAFLTGMVNMQVEAHSQGWSCDYDPRHLTTVTRNGYPVRTLARRVDGAFPAVVNPIAVWEIKEYYYTTTFGSRVADGVYESLLDGLELEELRDREGIDLCHYLMVDGRYTWWESGKSYLCRLIDILHMGYVDEILFGREVVSEMPRLVGEWVAAAKLRT